MSPDAFGDENEIGQLSALRARLAELESAVAEFEEKQNRSKRETDYFRRQDEIYLPTCWI